MCKVIAVSNQKGGVGKTTTTTSLAQVLKYNGYRVLVVDFDPQGNLSFSVGINSQESVTIYEVIKGVLPTNKAILKNGLVDLLSSNILLSGTEVEFTSSGREFLLDRALKSVKNRYDFVLVDTPPSLSILTVNAFVASDFVLVPLTPDIFSLQGVTEIFETVSYIKKTCNPQVEFIGMFLNKYNDRSKIQREVKGVCEMISEDTGIPLLKTCVRNSTAIIEAQSIQANIVDYAPRNQAVLDYFKLSEEIVEGIKNVGK